MKIEKTQVIFHIVTSVIVVGLARGVEKGACGVFVLVRRLTLPTAFGAELKSLLEVFMLDKRSASESRLMVELSGIVVADGSGILRLTGELLIINSKLEAVLVGIGEAGVMSSSGSRRGSRMGLMLVGCSFKTLLMVKAS